MTLRAVARTVTGLKGGSVSIVFHVPFEMADEAFKVHGLQDKSVALDIYTMEED